MKLVQKILSHGLLIAFIVAAIFIYTRRDVLLPQWEGKLPTETGVKDTSDQVKQEPFKNTDPPGTLSVSEPDHEKKQVLTEVLTPEPSEPATVVQPEPDQEALPQEALPEVEIQQEKDTPAAVKDVVTQHQTDTEPVEALPPPPVNVPDIKFQKQLAKARRYFWQHNLPAAAAAYQVLAEDYPENPDVWGEIGNFYFTLQQRQPVIRSYSRSVELLIERGELMSARRLVDVLYRLGSPRARNFEIQIQQAGG